MKLHVLAGIIPAEATQIRDEKFSGGWTRSQTFARTGERYEVLLHRKRGRKGHHLAEQVIIVRDGIRDRTALACSCGEVVSGKVYEPTLNRMIKHLG